MGLLRVFEFRADFYSVSRGCVLGGWFELAEYPQPLVSQIAGRVDVPVVEHAVLRARPFAHAEVPDIPVPVSAVVTELARRAARHAHSADCEHVRRLMSDWMDGMFIGVEADRVASRLAGLLDSGLSGEDAVPRVLLG